MNRPASSNNNIKAEVAKRPALALTSHHQAVKKGLNDLFTSASLFASNPDQVDNLITFYNRINNFDKECDQMLNYLHNADYQLTNQIIHNSNAAKPESNLYSASLSQQMQLLQQIRSKFAAIKPSTSPSASIALNNGSGESSGSAIFAFPTLAELINGSSKDKQTTPIQSVLSSNSLNSTGSAQDEIEFSLPASSATEDIGGQHNNFHLSGDGEPLLPPAAVEDFDMNILPPLHPMDSNISSDSLELQHNINLIQPTDSFNLEGELSNPLRLDNNFDNVQY
jgi:hypothetical protein